MYAIIGDLHGCFNTLRKLIETLTKKDKDIIFIFVGDLIDRGKYSKETLQFLLELSKHYRCTFLMGNHEDIFLNFIFGKTDENLWFLNGGKMTVYSFTKGDIKTVNDLRSFCYENIYEKFKNIFDNMKLYEEIRTTAKFLISHAGGLKLDIPLDKLDEDCKDLLLWERGIDFYDKPYKDYILVHGHTPTFMISKNSQNRVYINKTDDSIISINVDTGCVYGYSLSALLIDDDGEFDTISVACLD